MRSTIAALFTILALPFAVSAQGHAQEWSVEYRTAGSIGSGSTFYSPGAYQFLLRPEYIPAYLLAPEGWNFIGMYGAPYQSFPQASLPASFPAIAFPSGTDQAIATREVVPMPDPLARVRVARHLGGVWLNARLNPPLQRATAWGAAMLLGAERHDVRVVLPTKILDVQEWCSGVVTMKWLAVLAIAVGFLVFGLGSARGLMATAALVVAALAIGYEVNVLRVAAAGVGYGKEATGWLAVGAGVGQVVALGAAGRWVHHDHI